MLKMKDCYFLLLLLTLSGMSHAEFGFDDLEAMEQTEQTEILELAKKAAKRWDFSDAQALLKEAQQKGYAPDEIAQTKQVIADSRSAYQAEQDRKRREEQRRQEAEQQRLLAEKKAQQRRN
jgi:Skp family chaperone for outer membrane proteins